MEKGGWSLVEGWQTRGGGGGELFFQDNDVYYIGDGCGTACNSFEGKRRAREIERKGWRGERVKGKG